MDFSSEKKRRVGHVYAMGLVLYNIPTILKPPLVPPRHRQHQVLQVLTLALLQGGSENAGSNPSPPNQLYCISVIYHLIKMIFSVHHRNKHTYRKT